MWNCRDRKIAGGSEERFGEHEIRKLNPALRRVEAIGFIKGFSSLFNPRVPHVRLNPLFTPIPELNMTKGGTIIGASRDYVDQGMGLKVKVGAAADEDVDRVGRIAEAFGEDLWLAVDANERYDYDTALRMGRFFEEEVGVRHRPGCHRQIEENEQVGEPKRAAY